MDKKHITPSEINRFAYCNYQWYYEKKYGKKELNRLRHEHLKNIGFDNQGRESKLAQGIKFHQNHYHMIKKKMGIRKILFIIIIFLILAVLVGIFVMV